MQHRRATTPVLFAGLLALSLATPAWADNGSAGNESSPESDTQSISDEKVEQFVVAMSEVRRIRTEYTQKMQREMAQAIRDSGMKLEEYKNLGQRMGNDKQLQQRVRKMAAQQNQ